jgi:predicted dehydrogenase
VTRAEVEAQKPKSWWYKRAEGGGSLLDYLGYGATLGTWYMNGKAPLEVTCTVDQTPGIEVDQHSITVCRYDTGLSKMETRWGTFTDPWTVQPQPQCGFVFVGTDGTIQSHDYADHVMVQTRARAVPTPVPAAPLAKGQCNAVDYVLGCIARGEAITGPLDPAVSLIGQRIIDTAMQSAREKRTVVLIA